MSTIHFFLQGKGGVGKSFCAIMFSQFLQENNKSFKGFDTDPVNSTYFEFKKLAAKKFKFMENNEFNIRKFDNLIQEILDTSNENDGVHFIIDNGATSFIPLSDYLVSEDVFSNLVADGHKIFIHSPIKGGDNQNITLQHFADLLENFLEHCSFVPWLNQEDVLVERDGKSFEEFAVYLQNKNRIEGIINIPHFRPKMEGLDIKNMLTNRQTFSEALDDISYKAMERSRLRKARTVIFDAISAVPSIS